MKKLFVITLALIVMATSGFAMRGSSGHVNILYWQAPSILNPYLSGGTKELEAASLIIEPLARYDENGNMVPWLAESIPTTENGGVSDDLKTITWKIRDGLVWSDGSAFTSADVVFTHEYCTHPEGGCAQGQKFEDVVSVEALDDLTVKVTFGIEKPFPYGPFVGAQSPIIQKAQFENCLGTAAPGCTDQNFMPIGTGPFVVTEFRPNDVISLEANANYRDPAKPGFATVTFKGGGDATAAGRAVLETGEFDYAWNLQLAPQVIQQMSEAGKGQVISAFGTAVERIMVNMTDPSPERGEERSTRAHAHPFLSDINVRKALSLAIDRNILNEIGYGITGKPTCNVVPAPAIYASTANDGCLVQDMDMANQILDDAGWVVGSDGVREKDGMRLSMLYQTSTNAVRQDFQALIKQWWSEIGVETELRNLDASVFFGGDPGSPDTFQKFFADVEMYTNIFDGTDPEPYFNLWKCGREPSPDNGWQGGNIPRYCDDGYDANLSELSKTGDLNRRIELSKALNDQLMQEYIMIPLIHRGRVSAHSNSLGGVVLNPWDSELWNIADWHRK
ncbi:MAG: peptide ABC transporter substrate-binding protein [Rhodobacteraceae bacterium]|nr:peptide ABC transporter substrate-binding protein [Paracoccaceae bacterium]MYF46317.1 peptide ABC transporter substrate-binding protein [Paracoccaceae bacterium]MYI91304.1 peptide ABC transporter substrate-binding protein [Paracoccaceae bacterium]